MFVVFMSKEVKTLSVCALEIPRGADLANVGMLIPLVLGGGVSGNGVMYSIFKPLNTLDDCVTSPLAVTICLDCIVTLEVRIRPLSKSIDSSELNAGNVLAVTNPSLGEMGVDIDSGVNWMPKSLTVLVSLEMSNEDTDELA